MHSWGLSNFKSISSAKVELHDQRLTILSGTNSSGKSSILQSLLLLTQSRTSHLSLNGSLTRLGTPDDVVRDGQESIQFEFEFPFEDPRFNAPPQTLCVQISATPTPDRQELAVSDIDVIDHASQDVILSATTHRAKKSDISEIKKLLSDDRLSVIRVTLEAGRKAGSRTYLIFRGLTPIALAIHQSPELIKKTYKQTFIALQGESKSIPRLRFLLSELSNLVGKEDFFRENSESSMESISPSRNPNRWDASDWSSLSSELRKKLAEVAAARRAETPWVFLTSSFLLRSGPRVRQISDGCVELALASDHESTTGLIYEIADQIGMTAGKVRYLGPLRDEPRVVHSAWDERIDSLPVGVRGELTADLLTRLKDHQIEYGDWNGIYKTKALPDAVGEWCSYLGIGDEITVIDQGKLGRGVQLRVDGANRDLTTIGVGASQLLPVLVATLSARPGSLVLIEQPELHLHPAVQSKLADFFLFAQPGVHLIIETHSEYLLTRVRRRIAEGLVDGSEVSILFVEQLHGASTARTLAIDSFGDISQWPSGFFDAQDHDSLAIMKAVAQKLAAVNA